MKGSVLYRVIPFVAALLLLSLPAAAQTRITFATRVEREVYPEIIARFNETHSDIQVDLMQLETGGYGDKRSRCSPAVLGRTSSSLKEITNGFGSVMAKLDDFLAQDDELTVDALYAATFEPMTYKGSIYGLSEYVNPNGLVWFNKTMYQESGMESPLELEARGEWTMDRMRADARKLTRYSPDGTREGYGVHIPNWWGPLFSVLYTNGFSVTDEEGNLAINSQENLRAVEYLRQWVIEVRSTNVHEWPDEVALLSQKRLGMVVSGGWFTWLIDLIDPIEIDVVPMPVGIEGGRAAFISNPALAMNPDSPHKEAAWTFMRWILVGEGARMRAELESDLPSAIHLADLVQGPGPSWNHAMSASMDWAYSIPNALALRDSSDGLAMDVLIYGSGLEQVWRGEGRAGPRRLAASFEPSNRLTVNDPPGGAAAHPLAPNRETVRAPEAVVERRMEGARLSALCVSTAVSWSIPKESPYFADSRPDVAAPEGYVPLQGRYQSRRRSRT